MLEDAILEVKLLTTNLAYVSNNQLTVGETEELKEGIMRFVPYAHLERKSRSIG